MRECSTKMSNFMIHFILLLAVWLTIHFNKQAVGELLSTHVNEKVHLSIFFTVITFYLFLKASWISAHCSVGNHICSIQSSILIFNSEETLFLWLILLCLFALVLLNVISAIFFIVSASKHFNYEVLVFLLSLLLPTLIPNEKNLCWTWKKWEFCGEFLLSNIFIFMHEYHGTSVMGAFYELKKEILQIKWDYQQLLGIWSDKRTFYSILFFKITGVQNNTTLVKSDSLKVCNVMRKVLENECILHGVKLPAMRY